MFIKNASCFAELFLQQLRIGLTQFRAPPAVR
jgi:hypothetical protein